PALGRRAPAGAGERGVQAVKREKLTSPATIDIRPFAAGDAPRVRELFVKINRLLAPQHLKDAFEAYIAGSLREEIDRITEYYFERNGGFWGAVVDQEIIGMFALEAASDDAMELRRMYVEPAARRQGIARRMLRFAEDEC